jgi:hypothetical protein
MTELILARPIVDDLVAMFERITGRKATPDEIAEARRFCREKPEKPT